MDDRTFSSEQEYFDGRTKDGKLPNYHSRKLTDDPTKLYSSEPAVPPVADVKPNAQELEKRQLDYEIELQRLKTFDLCATFYKAMMDIGFKAIEEVKAQHADNPACQGRGSGEQAPETQPAANTEAPAPDDNPAGNGRGSEESASENNPACEGRGSEESASEPQPANTEAPDADPRPPATGGKSRRTDGVPPEDAFENYYTIKSGSPNQYRVADPKDANTKSNRKLTATKAQAQKAEATFVNINNAAKEKPLTLVQRIAIGERGAKLLSSIADKRAECAHNLVNLGAALDVRDRFLEDRALAVVHQTLLYLNDQYKELGFGSWMPFRWPDQWLSFCGVLTRVLAANGLIHGKYADVYRKLLDETPPVMPEGKIEDRIRETQTPHNPALCARFQGAKHMTELKERVQKEYWDPKDELQSAWDNHWEDMLIFRKPKDSS